MSPFRPLQLLIVLAGCSGACLAGTGKNNFDVSITLTAKPPAACTTQSTSNDQGGTVQVACDPAQFVSIEPAATTLLFGSSSSSSAQVQSAATNLSRASTQINQSINTSLGTGNPLTDTVTPQKISKIVFEDETTGNIVDAPQAVAGQTNSVTAYRYIYTGTKEPWRQAAKPLGRSSPIEMFIVF